MDRIGHFNLKFTNLIEAEVRLDVITVREDFKIGSGQIQCYRGRPRYGQDYRGRSRYNSNNRGSYRFNTKVIKGMKV